MTWIVDLRDLVAQRVRADAPVPQAESGRFWRVEDAGHGPFVEAALQCAERGEVSSTLGPARRLLLQLGAVIDLRALVGALPQLDEPLCAVQRGDVRLRVQPGLVEQGLSLHLEDEAVHLGLRVNLLRGAVQVVSIDRAPVRPADEHGTAWAGALLTAWQRRGVRFDAAVLDAANAPAVALRAA